MSSLPGAWYEAQTIVATMPALARPLQRLRGPSRRVTGDTDIVIEGFPRCASSFAVAAFRLAQEPRAMRIADHTHSPSEVIAGVRQGSPVLVLIRPAEPAVVSHLVRNPDLPVRPVLRGYLRFYETIAPLRHGFVVGTFDEVITDLGSVIGRVNARFGTRFAPFVHTPEHLERIEREIDDDYGSRVRGREQHARAVPRPTDDRATLRDEAAVRYARDAPPELRARADRIYDLLTRER